ncbi:MAG: PilZ domain-containing protein [Archangium sp.]|nr:PilZ domain-containing protein [Archangium sp.]MDP3151958.1 PilZ domain-containing protein [Archangium sp.]MDP3571371.1 PilZ domain-containing protein [Archangium sp.]
MHHVAPVESLQDRSSRAPLKHPVRVTIAGERVVRVLSGDISPNGMFLMMAEPPEPGTVVTLAFEAGGKVLPFAEGEVAWRRSQARGGFGVRFTRYLHPRAKALVDFLAENVENGSLKPQPAHVHPLRRWSGLAVLAAMVALLITWGAAPAKSSALEVGLACVPPAAAPLAPLAVAVAVPKTEPIVSTAVVAKKAAPKTNRLAEKPRAVPTLARTMASAVKPGQFSSTPIPSGAARLVNVSRVSGALRVAIDTVAGARVTGVTTVQNPARLIIDVTGLPPISTHVVSLNDSELRKISVVKQGKGTRLVIDLVRLPTRVVQQGDSALISF